MLELFHFGSLLLVGIVMMVTTTATNNQGIHIQYIVARIIQIKLLVVDQWKMNSIEISFFANEFDDTSFKHKHLKESVP